MTYEMDIAGLKRELPICKVTDDLYIGAFFLKLYSFSGFFCDIF